MALLYTGLNHRCLQDKTPGRDGQTGRRTDGQTDLPWLLQRSALRAMRTRCNATTPMSALRNENPGFDYQSKCSRWSPLLALVTRMWLIILTQHNEVEAKFSTGRVRFQTVVPPGISDLHRRDVQMTATGT